ncbi:hypothetical protein GOODEAATRI_015478 [Goodea atripinnis]|uniref:Uncharacterized protein n=1 Tax=Goodea atripinnis TaxID=208336 RepID=A0ABV0NLK2_9TELE
MYAVSTEFPPPPNTPLMSVESTPHRWHVHAEEEQVFHFGLHFLSVFTPADIITTALMIGIFCSNSPSLLRALDRHFITHPKLRQNRQSPRRPAQLPRSWLLSDALAPPAGQPRYCQLTVPEYRGESLLRSTACDCRAEEQNMCNM